MIIKKILFLASSFIVAISVYAAAPRIPAQPKIEDLPRVPVDTLDSSDAETKIILYSNNTFSYYRPQMSLYDELPAYTEHWDNSQIFSYKSIELKDLPDRIDLCLANNAGEFHTPVQGPTSSKYGVRKRRHHNGTDIPLKVGDPVYAAFDGKVRYAKFNTGGYGYLVILRHKNGMETWYAHLCRPNVEENEYVKAGQVIGFGGNTGRSFGAHLHFETRYCDQTFDAEFLFDFPAGQLKTELFALEKSYFNINSRASELLLEDEDGLDFSESDENLLLLAEMGDTTASQQLLALAVAREQAAEQKRKEAAAAAYHTVKSGDTLGGIARRYGVTVSQICRLSSITSTTTLRLGRQLRIK